MKVTVHILTFNEEVMLPYTLRHYKTFCNRMVVHDAFSTDRTREIAIAAGAEVVDWDTGGKFNDGKAMELKNTCWKGSDADLVIVVDADELIYLPSGAEATLPAYLSLASGVVKPFGYEMFSEVLPVGDGQIYEEIKYGAPDNAWYSKPVLFNPKLVASIDYGPGAHWGTMTLKNGRQVVVNSKTAPTSPACYLLHFHQIGPAERLAERYDAALARQSEANLKNGWGNRAPGAKHVQEKRDFIKKDLQRIIP